jgi:hypothetical protein
VLGSRIFIVWHVQSAEVGHDAVTAGLGLSLRSTRPLRVRIVTFAGEGAVLWTRLRPVHEKESKRLIGVSDWNVACANWIKMDIEVAICIPTCFVGSNGYYGHDSF